ncbi:MAG: ATP-binding protein, partial [Pseudomonadota bacterium]
MATDVGISGTARPSRPSRPAPAGGEAAASRRTGRLGRYFTGLPLRLKFFLLLAPITLGVFAIALGAGLMLSYAHDRETLTDKLDHLVSNQTIIIAESLHEGNRRRIGLILAGVMADPDIVFAEVRDRQSRALLSLGERPEVGTIRTLPVRYVVNSRVIDLGTIALGTDFARANEVLLINLIALTVAGTIAVVGSWWGIVQVFRHLIDRRIDRLGDEIARWRRTSGEPSIALGGDEIATLHAAFTGLRAEKQRYEEALHDVLADLEQRIEERTQALTRARDEAERASAAKADFLASMSHEIRTPMNAILSIGQHLADGLPDEQNQRSIAVLRNAGESLMGLLNDVLDFSKIEAGHVSIDPVATDLSALLSELGELWTPEARAKGLALDVRVEGTVPDGLLVDPLRVRQCVGNLLANAVKFTASGRISVTLGIDPGERAGSRMVSITVADTGTGIAPEAIATLFDPFTQADSSTTRRYGGTGLGLAITRQLAVLMGGGIAVQSEPGRGARFTLTFEARHAADAATAREAPAVPDLSDRNILVVDDVATNRFVARLLIEPTGASVREAASAADALRQLRERPADLVLLDLHMPEIDGAEAIGMIRALPGRSGRCRIVALTADTRREMRERLTALGIDGYLTKPF